MLGLAIFYRGNISLPIAVVVIAVFGICHSYAHGVEMPNQDNPTVFIIGLLFTIARLHILGLILGMLILEKPKGQLYVRICGLGIFLIGIGLVVT